MNGGHGESLGIRNRKKLIGDLFKNSSSKGAVWENFEDRLIVDMNSLKFA